MNNKPHNDSPVLACYDLCRSYQDANYQVGVLNDLTAEFFAGERVAIVGSSGSGKSSLLHLLGGLDQPSSGYVTVMGERLDQLSEVKKGKLRNRTLGFVYQFHHLLPEFNAWENIALPLLIQGVPASEAQQRAHDLLKRVDLENRATHRVQTLSGGERQRVAICRAVVTEPKCLLADEPTGNLDHKSAAMVFDLLLSLNEQLNLCLLVVTHDHQSASRMDRVLTLSQGQLRPVDVQG